MNLLKLVKREPLIVIGLVAVAGFVLGSGKLPVSLPSLSPKSATAPPPSSTPGNVAATAANPPASSSWLDGM